MYEKKAPTPSPEETAAKTPRESESAAQKAQPLKNALAWEAAEIGDEVSIRYIDIVCESRDEAFEVYYAGKMARLDARRMGEQSVLKVLEKERAARKDAMRDRYSCSVPGSLRGVRFRVERKEITGKSERDVFYTVAYCLRPDGKDRCVWNVWDHDSDTPFENVQRAQQ